MVPSREKKLGGLSTQSLVKARRKTGAFLLMTHKLITEGARVETAFPSHVRVQLLHKNTMAVKSECCNDHFITNYAET